MEYSLQKPETYDARPGESHEIETQETPAWLLNIIPQLESLIALPSGWDGPYSQPTDHDALSKLLDILNRLNLKADTQIPQLVPLSSGGVQAEWHYNGKVIEVGVDTAGFLSVFVDQNGNYDLGVENVLDFSEGTVQQIMLHLHNLGQNFGQLGE
jgi:hypothetical protein